jgi:myo-inositol-1(or 4)-monophosphatase
VTPEPAFLGHCRDVAVDLAHAAGAELVRLRSSAQRRVESKGRRRELVTAADRAAEQIVVGGLLAGFPGHGVLAEEGVLTAPGQITGDSEWTWIVDPLDGTTNFVHGLPFYAVAIALAFRHRPVVGVVHAPALGETWVGVAKGGAERRFADGRREPVRVSATVEVADALLATGFSYNRNEPGRDDNSARLARVLPHCRDLRRVGSAELDICCVAGGIYDAFWELYLAPYDVAAAAVILREAGGRISDLIGGEDWLHGGQVLASNGHLHEALLGLVGGAP